MQNSTQENSWTPQSYANDLALSINSIQDKVECELDTIRYHALGTTGLNETTSYIAKLRAERHNLINKRREVYAFIEKVSRKPVGLAQQFKDAMNSRS